MGVARRQFTDEFKREGGAADAGQFALTELSVKEGTNGELRGGAASR